MDFINKAKKLFGIIFLSKKMQARLAGVHLGNNCMVASRFWSTEPYLITIGNNCQITHGVLIHTHGGGQAIRRKIPDFDCFGKVVVGDFVYIGSRTMIMPGVTIGNHVLIAGGSIVTKSVPSNVVVAGNPAKIICTIDEYAERNMKYNMGTKGLSQSKKRKVLENIDIDRFIKKRLLV